MEIRQTSEFMPAVSLAPLADFRNFGNPGYNVSLLLLLYQLSYEAITVGSRSILVGQSCH